MTIDNSTRTMIWDPRRDGPRDWDLPRLPGCGKGHWEWVPDQQDRFQPRPRSSWEKRQELRDIRARISRIEMELGMCRLGGEGTIHADLLKPQPFFRELPEWIRPREKTCCCHNPREQMLRMELSMLRCREQQLERELHGNDDCCIMPYAKAM